MAPSNPKKTETARHSADVVSTALPKQGDSYHCEQCGMELEITQSCGCDDADMVRLECCGQEMAHSSH